MVVKKDDIRKLLMLYMKQRNLGYINLEASLSMDKKNLLINITEDEDDNSKDLTQWN